MNRFSFKSYLLDNQEYYQYTYDLKEPEVWVVQDIPFPESLTSFTYLGEERYCPLLEQLDGALSVLSEQRTDAAVEAASELLMKLGKVHIYFELFRLEWQSRLMDAAENGFADMACRTVAYFNDISAFGVQRKIFIEGGNAVYLRFAQMKFPRNVGERLLRKVTVFPLDVLHDGDDGRAVIVVPLQNLVETADFFVR